MEILHILLIIAAIFIAYFVFLYFTQISNPEPVKIVKESMTDHIIPATMPIKAMPIAETTEYEEETPLDPYANEQEIADMPERMRKPDRMFQQAPENNGMPIDSGLMGTPHSGVGGYASEMVQNEGEFMPGIFAFDKEDSQSFSMF
jgi:hypothetical protein